ncbi:MAG: helix-turn-helix domain-containing protein [Anaeromyxobacteraceae bacterium]
MTPPAPATRPPAPPMAGRIDLDDFDAMLAVSPSWSERHSQVSRGRARIRLALATTGRMQLAYAAKSPGCRIDGAPVPGMSLLGITLAGPFLQLQGQLWRPDRFGYVPSGSEYAVLGSAPHRMLALAVQSDLLDRAARSRWGHGLPVDRSGPVLRERRPGGSTDVARTWIRWVATAVRHPDLLRDPAVSGQMEDEVLGSILDASEMVDGPEPARPWRELALRAEAHLRDTLTEAPQLPEICRAVRATPRSLHASFKAIFNTTPKAYQIALRLDAVRHELLRATAGTTVTSVAMKWGFFQLGRFSGDYRRMFGEGPRETLKRTRDARATRVYAFPAIVDEVHRR